MEINAGEVRSLLEKLQTTEGWIKLPPVQQQIIRASLSISDRAFRGSAEKRFLDIDAVRPPNAESKRHIASELCHTAIAALEKGKLVTNPYEEENLRFGENFFEAEYTDITNKPGRLDRLIARLQKFGYPAVVQPGVDPKIIQPPAVHSFLALGKGSDGKIYWWDKQGLGLPYRVMTLEDENKQYEYFTFWGIRKLRNLITRGN